MGYALHWHSGDVSAAVDDDEEGQDEQEGQDDSDEQEGKEKSRSKVKYTCPACHLNVWGKPGLLLLCGNCTVATQAPVILLDPAHPSCGVPSAHLRKFSPEHSRGATEAAEKGVETR